MSEPGTTEGQAASPDSAGTTGAAPEGSNGQSATQGQTTSAGPDSGQESFFDPKSIEGKPELMSAYKQMQGQFTKRMTEFKDGGKKMEAYDAFMADPQGTMTALAKQYGYSLVQGESGDTEEAPKTWDDVYARAKAEVMNELQPMLGEVQQLKQKNVEQYLDGKFTDWRTYEGDMMKMLKAHPSMAHDPDLLYRATVPPEVLEARATKDAMDKLKGVNAEGRVAGPSTTSNQATSGLKDVKTFNDAVAVAKARLAEEGIRP